MSNGKIRRNSFGGKESQNSVVVHTQIYRSRHKSGSSSGSSSRRNSQELVDNGSRSIVKPRDTSEKERQSEHFGNINHNPSTNTSLVDTPVDCTTLETARRQSKCINIEEQIFASLSQPDTRNVTRYDVNNEQYQHRDTNCKRALSGEDRITRRSRFRKNPEFNATEQNSHRQQIPLRHGGIKENKETPLKSRKDELNTERTGTYDNDTVYSGVSCLTIPILQAVPYFENWKKISCKKTVDRANEKQRSYSFDFGKKHLYGKNVIPDCEFIGCHDIPNCTSETELIRRRRHRSRGRRRRSCSKDFGIQGRDGNWQECVANCKYNDMDYTILTGCTTQPNVLLDGEEYEPSANIYDKMRREVEVQERFTEIKDKIMPHNSENAFVLICQESCVCGSNCYKPYENSPKKNETKVLQKSNIDQCKNEYKSVPNKEEKHTNSSIPELGGINCQTNLQLPGKRLSTTIPKYILNENSVSTNNEETKSKHFTPRVLRPRRRRTRSQDFGTEDRFTEIFSKPTINSLKQYRSLDDISVEKNKLLVHDKSNLDSRFQELLDTYLFGADGNKTRGKVVRRNIKDKTKYQTRQRSKETGTFSNDINQNSGYTVGTPLLYKSCKDKKSRFKETTYDKEYTKTEDTLGKTLEIDFFKKPCKEADSKIIHQKCDSKSVSKADNLGRDIEEMKQYDRDFLMKMQFQQQSKCKPLGLPDLPEIMLKNTSLAIKDGMEYERKKFKTQRVIRIHRNMDEALKRIENPYIPRCKQTTCINTDVSKENSKLEEFYRKVRSILNKLTPEKFEKLSNDLVNSNVNTEEALKGIIDIIYQKAMDEPTFSVIYAKLCKLMCERVSVPVTSNERLQFKKLLISRCQEEIEKRMHQPQEMHLNMDMVKEANKNTEPHAKIKSLGNIRFIGELFNVKMLSERFMHDCIMDLVMSNDEENLECLCKLLTTVGMELDHGKAKPLMDQYFSKIDKLINGNVTSPRIKFLLRDVQELRSRNWQPRRKTNTPKKIDQIQKKAAQNKN